MTHSEKARSELTTGRTCSGVPKSDVGVLNQLHDAGVYAFYDH